MINVSILGGSGYAGGELLRILLSHPKVKVHQVTSRKLAQQPVSYAHPNLRKVTDLVFVHPDQLGKCDLLFVALPNGESMGRMKYLMTLSKKIIDLGADFRLRDAKNFNDWYGREHQSPELLGKFVYGLAELNRRQIKKASYVACGGCEATVSTLALYPLVKYKLIGEKVIIDAKMSSSQVGVTPSFSTHHPERAGAVRSYMPAGHRHTAEIEQELAKFKKLNVAISATAIDMVRGLLVTIHCDSKPGLSQKDVWKAYRAEYTGEPFVRIVKEAVGIYRYPEPKILMGTNFCDIGFELDSRGGRLVVIGAIDNLVKGTAGQAVQAANVMYGFSERMGLEFPGLHPV